MILFFNIYKGCNLFLSIFKLYLYLKPIVIANKNQNIIEIQLVKKLPVVIKGQKKTKLKKDGAI